MLKLNRRMKKIEKTIMLISIVNPRDSKNILHRKLDERFGLRGLKEVRLLPREEIVASLDRATSDRFAALRTGFSGVQFWSAGGRDDVSGAAALAGGSAGGSTGDEEGVFLVGMEDLGCASESISALCFGSKKKRKPLFI
ncbi:hypothetical protein BHM03_00004913 [Ensete ventricosum]|nr:hypothetical protein BHM03_00004913 [Ensete ventricosum]